MTTVVRRRTVSEASKLDPQLPPLIRRLLAARQLTDSEQLVVDVSGLIPPDQLLGCTAAAGLLADALAAGKRLLVLGDFDADGATSCALAVLALRAMGAVHIDFLVPNRFEFGYGLTPEIVAVAAQQRPDLIITVDNGISSIEGVARARELDIDVLVTDHHLPAAQLPAAVAIVNPNQPGCSFPSKCIAGVGVIFYLMMALRQELRRRDWFSHHQLAEPNLAELLDLVALGTVADVVKLDRNNRILVEQGLRRIRAGQCRPGILALLQSANRSPQRVVSSDLGFTVGPRLNAAGRLDDMTLGIRCLLTDDPVEARALATELDSLNRDRRAIEGEMQRQAIAALESSTVLDVGSLPWGLCMYDGDWHQGVIGILASRLKERYHRPVIAFADADQSGWIKGSARSVPGLHIRDTLDAVAAANPGLLSRFGGHAMAAGMTIRKQDFDAFQQQFDHQVRQRLSEADLQAVIYTDGELAADELTLSVAEQLRYLLPWGQGVPEPLFEGEFRILQQRLVGSSHLKLTVSTGDGNALDAIAFNVDTGQWPNTTIDRVHLVYRLDSNVFRGDVTLQLVVVTLIPL